MRYFGSLALLLACAALAPAAAGASRSATPLARKAAKSCWQGYSYNGVQSPTAAFGVSGTLTLAAASNVTNGHVAAWIGVGGAGLGPGGADEWLQAGIDHDAGGTDTLYVEYKRPGDANATFIQLGAVAPGDSHTFVIFEQAHQPDSWRVLIDGQSVVAPVALPGSHGRFAPVATAENWDGGIPGSCNGYAYSFTNLAVRSQFGGTWQAFDLSHVLRDPGYQLALRASGFSANS